MKKLFLILLLAPTLIIAQQFNYLPNETGNQVVVHSQYTLSYTETHEQAEWVAYELTAVEVRKKCDRTDNFREDPAVSTGSATLADYKGSGYDRGHLSPASDNKINCPTAMSESFFMSNMSPQIPGFNRGVWRRLETQVRDWATEYKKIYVVSGPVFVDNLGEIGDSKVTIPGKYYKVILDAKRMAGIGFILPNESSSADLSTFAISIDEIETQTGLDFFPSLEDTEEADVESSNDTGQWVWN